MTKINEKMKLANGDKIAEMLKEKGWIYSKLLKNWKHEKHKGVRISEIDGMYYVTHEITADNKNQLETIIENLPIKF